MASPQGPPTFLGSAGCAGYVLIGGIAIAVVAILGALFYVRPHRPRPPPAANAGNG